MKKTFRTWPTGRWLAAFFFVALLPCLAWGQQIHWSAPLGDDNQMKYLKIIGSDDQDFFILRSNQSFTNRRASKGRKLRLVCFTMNMALRWDKVLTGTDVRILDVTMVSGRVLVTSLARDGDDWSVRLQYIRSDGTFENQPVVGDTWSAQKTGEESPPDLLVSNDQSLFAIASRMRDKNLSQQVYRAVVFDTTLTRLYTKEIRVEPGDKEFVPSDMAISDSGNIYLLGSSTTVDRKGRPVGESSYVLYAWWRKADSLSVQPLTESGAWLTDAALACDNRNNAAVVAGFYSHSQSTASAGVFYFHSHPGERTSLKLSAFNDEILSKVRVNKMDLGKELTDYSIEKILVRRDGGAVLSAEAFSTYSRSYYDYYTNMLISHTYYSYGDILTLSINPDGSLHWSDLVNKEHNSVDDDGYLSSYCSAVYKARMYYIYNKYIESQTSVMLTSVNIQGEQQTLVLFNELEHVVAVPKAARQTEEDVLLLPAFRENKLCIARINL